MPYDLLTGDQIKLNTITNWGVGVALRITLKETKTEVNDGSCSYYPTNKHESYTACIDTEMRERSCQCLGVWCPGWGSPIHARALLQDSQNMKAFWIGFL